MMDLLIQVTSAHRISPGGHVIQLVSDNPLLSYQPSTPIGKHPHPIAGGGRGASCQAKGKYILGGALKDGLQTARAQRDQTHKGALDEGEKKV